MLQILLIRHAETDYNKNKLFCGISDVGLNSTGMEQASKLAEALREERIDYIYTSSMKRCIETGRHLECANEKIITEELREMNFGQWEGLTYDEIKKKYPMELNEWEKDWINYALPEGECFREMSDRVIKLIDEIILNHRNKKAKIAVITHSGSIRAILGKYIIGSVEESWKFRVDNAAVSRLNISDDYIYLRSLNER